VTNVYVSRSWNWRGTDVHGATPFICDGGLRYLDSSGKWQSAWVGGYHGTSKQIDWEQVEGPFADYFGWMREHNVPYMLNVEHAAWNIFDRTHVSQIAANITRLRAVLKTPVWFYPMTAARVTGMMEGYLRWREASRTWSFARLLAEAQRLSWNSPPRQFSRWQTANEIAVPLIDATGVATPSVYRTYQTMHPDNLREHVRESVRIYGIYGFGSKIYPVACPCYANNQDASINGLPIPMEDFESDIAAIRAGGANGICLWSAIEPQVTERHVEIARAYFPA
jgi:hypothetical protein